MSKKTRKRLKNKKQNIKFKNFKKYYKYLLMLVVLFIILFLVYCLLFKNAYFELKDIKVQGEYPLSSSMILRETPIELNKSIWSVNLKNTSLILREKYPEYQKVSLERILPDTLVFSFKLRKPIAQIKSKRYYLIDSEGFILPQVKNIATPKLPLITGIDSRWVGLIPGQRTENESLFNALSLLKTIMLSDTFSLDDIVCLDVSDSKNLLLEFKNSIVVKIGDKDFEKRINRLKYVFEEIKEENIRYIDLRFRDPVLTPR